MYANILRISTKEKYQLKRMEALTGTIKKKFMVSL